jgi:phage FluMu protein Com
LELTQKAQTPLAMIHPKANLSHRTECLGCGKLLFFGEITTEYVSIQCKNRDCKGINVFEGRKRSFIPK